MTTKAENVIKTMDSLKNEKLHDPSKGSPVGSVADVKMGQTVLFKAGTEYEGNAARVMDMDPAKGTLTVLMGSTVLPEVPASDLVLSDNG